MVTADVNLAHRTNVLAVGLRNQIGGHLKSGRKHTHTHTHPGCIDKTLQSQNRPVYIARQHAERDIVLPMLSVCPSVCLSNAGTVSKSTYRHIFLTFW